MIDAILNLVYPPVCQMCREQRATAPEGYVCADCWRRVKFITPPFCGRCGLTYPGDISEREFQCGNCQGVDWAFDSARSAVHFESVVHDAILRYKYQSALWFEPFLADLLIRQAGPVLRAEKWDWLVPAPLHPAKLREREFNQAERLAKRLSAATGIPVRDDLVRRVKPTDTQTKLNRPARMANVAEAFAFSRAAELDERRIVVIDDVLTTGATTNACAAALRQAGAAKIVVWTVARGA